MKNLQYSGVDGQIQQALGPVNSPLQQLARQGYTKLSALPDPRTHRLALRASVPNVPIKLTVSQLVDQITVDPKYRNLIHTFAKMRVFNTDLAARMVGATSAFTCSVPADVRTIPIHIDIQRDVSVIITGSGTSTVVEPQGIPMGGMRSIDLTYNRTTGSITGSGISQLGMAVEVLSDRSQGVTFLATIEDNGRKPSASVLTSLKEQEQSVQYPKR